MASTRRGERGSSTLFLVGTTVVVMFLGGLSVDSWRLLAARRQLSATADAIALAAASGLDDASLRTGGARLHPLLARRRAAAEFAQHVTRSSSVAYSLVTTSGRATVVMTQRVGVTLLGILVGRVTVVVRVRAVAAPRRTP